MKKNRNFLAGEHENEVYVDSDEESQNEDDHPTGASADKPMLPWLRERKVGVP